MSKTIQLEGRNVVAEAFAAGYTPIKVFVDAGSVIQSKLRTICDLAAASGVPVLKTPRDQLNRMSRTGVHQGVIALVASPRRRWTLSGLLDSLEDQGIPPFLLVLCRVQLEQNLGALFRTADACGVHGILVPTRNTALPGTEAIRVSAGAALHVPLIQEGTMAATKTLRRRGVWIVGAEAGAGRPYFKADLTGPLALVLGGEDEGLSSSVKQQCDFLVHLPLAGRIPSLNVSAAAAVLMFEKVRQESCKEGSKPRR